MPRRQYEARLAMDALMDRVKALDPDLERELSEAVVALNCEHEENAVYHHGQQILAVIEGRGYTGYASGMNYDDAEGLAIASEQVDWLLQSVSRLAREAGIELSDQVEVPA